MKLPKIDHPTFEIELPSTGEKVKFRPFLAKEQKILLMAKETIGDASSGEGVMKSVIDVIQSCAVTPGFVAGKMSIFDVEYTFIVLRGKSVSNSELVKIKDEATGQVVEARVDFDRPDLVKDPEHNAKKLVNLSDTVAIKLKYPSVIDSLDPKADMIDTLIYSIDSIVSGEEYAKPSDFSKQEMREWVMNLPTKTLDEIRGFFDTRPRVRLGAEYELSDGSLKIKYLEGFADFFEFA